MNNANHNLKSVADSVACALVDVNIRGGSAFIGTPLLYPSDRTPSSALTGQAIVGSFPTMALELLRLRSWAASL